MHVLVVQNYRDTSLGQVEVALREAGAEIAVCRAFEGEPVPADHHGFGGLVILGGDQNALDDSGHPYLPALADLARQFGAADKAVLGICLGAQLVARGYGAEIVLGNPIEFGWHEVRPTAAGRDDPVTGQLGGGAPLFHWHTDTFTLPHGAVHLARSERTAIQAFRLGRAVYAIQFHFEADRALVRHWNATFHDEIAAHTPDWATRHEPENTRHGSAADRVGLALARRWVSLIQPG